MLPAPEHVRATGEPGRPARRGPWEGARARETSWCQGRWAARPERAPRPRQPAAQTCLGVGEGSPSGAAGTPARGFLAPGLPGQSRGAGRPWWVGEGGRRQTEPQAPRPHASPGTASSPLLTPRGHARHKHTALVVPRSSHNGGLGLAVPPDASRGGPCSPLSQAGARTGRYMWVRKWGGRLAACPPLRPGLCCLGTCPPPSPVSGKHSPASACDRHGPAMPGALEASEGQARGPGLSCLSVPTAGGPWRPQGGRRTASRSWLRALAVNLSEPSRGSLRERPVRTGPREAQGWEGKGVSSVARTSGPEWRENCPARHPWAEGEALLTPSWGWLPCCYLVKAVLSGADEGQLPGRQGSVAVVFVPRCSGWARDV